MQWPPDYLSLLNRRVAMMKKAAYDLEFRKLLFDHYRYNVEDFIEDWAITLDPRARPPKMKKMPFILFPRQKDLLKFFQSCLDDNENGLCEKSRDMGATWLACAFSIHQFLFVQDSAIGWGSRKEELVDRLGDPSSIFEKLRAIMNNLPRFFWPVGFEAKKHMTFMKMINPENGSSITGEIGDNIGRGGRTTMYFKDESAHYPRPDLVEGAIGDNTECAIDISSVNGPGNVFYRRRQAGQIWEPGKIIDPGIVRVFILDWRDHPEKDQVWYEKKRKKAESEGLSHIFAQETDRDYTASLEGIIIPAKWVKAAIDAHKVLGIEISGAKMAALDVADEGGDLNALARRFGILLNGMEAWGEGDTSYTAGKAVNACRAGGINTFFYDNLGVGAGIKGETNRLQREGAIPKSLKIVKWAASDAVMFPEDRLIRGDIETPKNKDFFENLKAQAWWELRRRFELTFNAVTKGIMPKSMDDLISISSDLSEMEQLIIELSQATFKTSKSGKIMVDKKPEGSKSPNRADAVVMVFWPSKIEEEFAIHIVG